MAVRALAIQIDMDPRPSKMLFPRVTPKVPKMHFPLTEAESEVLHRRGMMRSRNSSSQKWRIQRI